MKTYKTVEDYLEVLSGHRDPVTEKVAASWFFGFNPIISLARYDVDVLTSMSESTVGNKPLTEKQGELLCKILLKYQRQLAAKSIDVSPVESPTWRLPLRTMDYSKSVSVVNDMINLRFPFQNKLIEELRGFRTSSQGKCVFDREKKIWEIALTEYNLNWIHTWAKANGFDISPDIEALNNAILDVESIPYAIELRFGEEQLEITNAPNSLTEYVNDHLGGFAHSNLLRLLDASSLLGFSIEPALADVVIQQWGIRHLTLASNREVRIAPNTHTVDDDFISVLKYAVETNRLPVVIYEPDLSGRLLQQIEKHFDQSDYISVGNNKRPTDTDGKKFIHTFKPIRNLDRIPMLVSSAGMIFGGDKQIMTQRTEKIVFISSDVYNATGGSGNKTRKVPKLI